MSALDPFTVLAGPPQPPKPAPPPALIRPFNSKSDLKVTRYLVGAGIMEPSSIANRFALWTIPSLILCALISHLIVTGFTRGWLPIAYDESHNFYEYLRPTKENLFHFALLAPILVSPPIILLALFELRHRSLFEQEMKRGVGEDDMRDIDGYYNVGEKNAGREGFWVLEYDNRIIGTIAVDARNPGKGLASVVDAPPPPTDKDGKAITDGSDGTAIIPPTSSAGYALRQRKPAASSPTSTTSIETLQIRRFATSMSFRPADIEDDLISHVASIAFSPSTSTSSPAKNLVISLRPKVEKGLLSRLQKAGFKPVPAGSKLEIEYEGEGALEAKKKEEEKKWSVRRVVESVRDRFWFVDLERRTFVLSREDWERKQK